MRVFNVGDSCAFELVPPSDGSPMLIGGRVVHGRSELQPQLCGWWAIITLPDGEELVSGPASEPEARRLLACGLDQLREQAAAHGASFTVLPIGAPKIDA